MDAVALVLLLAVAHVCAYIPAVPTNDTNAVNQTDMSMLSMKWAPAGTYSNVVSLQLSSLGSQGFHQGALVHFSEKGLTDQNSTTPWIALVNCDANTTDASEVDDIFTLARDRGAVAALLYSVKSEACLINPEYASPDNFEQILDIFATQSKSSAGLINSQFTNLHNQSFANFDAALLNQSANSVLASMSTSNVTSSFIVASLRAANSTVNPNGTDTGSTASNSDAPSGGDPGHGNPNTGLAMIILYAITGCVSALFIVVILSGAIRAIRHPERYGPRAGGANGGVNGTTSQSRTGGIGRAILDTFPIIKFGQTTATTTTPEHKQADVENQVAPIEMNARNSMAKDPDDAHSETPDSTHHANSDGMDTAGATTSSAPGTQVADEEAEAAASTRSDPAAGSSSASAPRTSDVAAGDVGTTPAGDEVRPGAIGHETCPICIVDFQEGDDLRVLPCEGKHKFHQACVDPWLLELSSSCPLCREDFHALESMMAGNEAAEAEDAASPPDASPSSVPATRSSRFSKYLKFARRRNRGAEPSASSPPDAPQTGSA